jgi:hypothetical protein
MDHIFKRRLEQYEQVVKLENLKKIEANERKYQTVGGNPPYKIKYCKKQMKYALLLKSK